MHKVYALVPSVLAAGAIAFSSLPAQAGLVNQDTGEGYWPSLDEEGNLEEPPDWVLVGHDTTVVVPEVLVDQDYCASAVGLWLDDGNQSAVSGAMSDATVQSALHDGIETWIRDEIASQLSELPDEISVGTANLLRLACPSSPYTYLDCLQDGGNWVYCKQTFPKQPIAPHSDLTVSIDASGPLGIHGTATITGGLRYRELWSLNRTIHQGCFILGDITLDGFSGVQNAVTARIEQLFDSDGELCLSPP